MTREMGAVAMIRQRLPVLAVALWWGGLSAVGFLAVPLMFAHAPSPAVAGNIAAQLFSAMTWVSVACGFVLIFALKPPRDGEAGAVQAGAVHTGVVPTGATPPTSLALTGWVLAGVILALLVEFAVAPRIVARENLRLWHGLGTGMYVLQWLCASVVLWKLAGGRGRPADDAGR